MGDVLLGYFTAEWQKLAIACSFIVLVLTIGLTEASKQLQLFSFLDEALPPKEWKRNVRRFAFTLGCCWSLLILPALVDGTLYERSLKVVVLAAGGGVLACLGFDLIKLMVRLFQAVVIEKVRALVRHHVVEKPAQRGDDIDEDSTVVKFARGKDRKK